MKAYTLTSDLLYLYDSDDGAEQLECIKELHRMFGFVNPMGNVTVYHPDGYVIDVFGDC